jgi:uncharacterized protein (TIGR03118 family)
VLSGNNFIQTNLTSDLANVAQNPDGHLVNPWGISEGPKGDFWVSDNQTGLSTLYNSNGVPAGLVVQIPPGSASPQGSLGTPTGQVFNSTSDFVIPGTNKPATFIFVTEDGTISAWNPTLGTKGTVPATLVADNSASGAVYKGVALGPNSQNQNELFVANFNAGTVDVFDSGFHPVTTLPQGAFQDPKLPPGYAPFGIQNINGKIYVTYALQDAAKHDDVPGPGKGLWTSTAPTACCSSASTATAP